MNPCELKFLRLLLEGMKRILARPVVRKEPVTPDILFRMVTNLNTDCMKDLRTCSICFWSRMQDFLGLMK